MAIRVSPGSGATVATEILNGANYQQIKVIDATPGSSNTWTINPDGSGLFSTNNLTSLASGTIILASQNGTWNTGITGNISLASGTEVRSLATILNFPTTQAVSFNQLISLASGTQILANQNGIWTVNINGLVSLASGTTVLASFGGVISLASGQTIMTQEQNLISLASGTEVRSLATILNFPATQAVSFNQLVSLASGTQVLVNQNGTWNMGITGLISLASGTSVLTSFSGVISLASGQEIRSLATINNFPASYPVINLVSIASINGLIDVKQNGVWNVNTSTASITGLVNLVGTGAVSNASLANNFIDTITLGQYGGDAKGSLASGSYHPLQTDNFGNLKVQLSNGLISLASGQFIGLNPTSNFIGLVSTASIQGNIQLVNTLVSLASGTVILSKEQNLISLASGTLVGLNPSSNFIGLATVIPAYPFTTYTSMASVISASGNSTLFVPPNGQRWVLKDLLISSMGNTLVQIQSEGRMMIPFTALATTGGYISNFGDSGLAAASINGAFVVNNNSAVTISVMANVRFQST